MLTLTSPNGRVQAGFSNSAYGLQWSLSLDDAVIVEPSPLGLSVDGLDLGKGAELGPPKICELRESYATRGHHQQATSHSNALYLPIVTAGTAWRLEACAFDDGLAFRMLVPGNGARRVDGERSGWTLPAQTGVWIAERPNNWKLKSYAGSWMRTGAEELPHISSQGPVQAPPLVLELPGGAFAALTEAALCNYSGMRLRAVGDRRVEVDFTEGEAGFQVQGQIITPWRVTMVADDLNGLVNSDLLTSLNPAPDLSLYPGTGFIRPGRCVWRWWSCGTGTPEQERQFVEYAAELGFEYTLVDDGWKDWDNAWTELAGICALGHREGVGVLVWKDYKDVAGPENGFEQLREWLDGVSEAGASGVKIDFMNAESLDKIDFQMAALRETARRGLLLLFHGCQKPGGEVRTWPHEITREGIRGLELNKMAEGPITAAHNAALPFTRFVAGHGDYTPVGYSNPGPTTWVHQLATAVIFTSPLQVIAEHPETLLRDPETQPALDVLKRMPSVWDETRVLAPSKIGELAVFARRTGQIWFLAALNNETPIQLDQMDLTFLGDGRFDAILLSSPRRAGFERREVSGVDRDFKLKVSLAEGDGFVAMLEAAGA